MPPQDNYARGGPDSHPVSQADVFPSKIAFMKKR
jgi:hypothetical protein